MNLSAVTYSLLNSTGIKIGREDLRYMQELLAKFDSEDSYQEDEELMVMANNILDTIKGKEIDYCVTIEGSRVIENICGYADEEKFQEFACRIFDFLDCDDKLFHNSRGLFVLESLVKVLALRSVPNKSEDDEPQQKRSRRVHSVVNFNLNMAKSEEHRQFCLTSLPKFSNYFLLNFEKIIYDKNASHLVRCYIEAVGGLINQARSRDDSYINLKEQHSFTIPKEWIEIVSDFTLKMSSLKHKADFIHSETASLVIQSLIRTLKNLQSELDPNVPGKLVKFVIKRSLKLNKFEEDGDVTKLFRSSSSVRLFEELFGICDETTTTKIYEQLIKSRIMAFCNSPELNFTIQKFICSSISSEVFEEIFQVVCDNFNDILSKGHAGIIVSLCKTCEQRKLKQGQFIQNLTSSLECANQKSESFIFPILCLKKISNSKDMGSNGITLHGSLVMQHMLKFNKPIKIVQNMLEMKPYELANIFCDSKGSRVADVFFESQYIGEKNREKLVKHLEGTYVKLATSKSGAFVLEKFFNVSSITQKEIIVKELSEKMNQLKGSMSGKILIHKFFIEIFLRNFNQWKSKVQNI